MIKNKLLNIIIILLLFTNCGFKIKNNTINYKLTDIISEGDRKINFEIKNSLINNSNEKSITQKKIFLKTTKNKSIAEKNIKNEITKYKIIISVELELLDLNENQEQSFSISKEGTYDVSSTYSVSLNNEKKLEKLLIISLTEKIIEELAEINDDI